MVDSRSALTLENVQGFVEAHDNLAGHPVRSRGSIVWDVEVRQYPVHVQTNFVS